MPETNTAKPTLDQSRARHAWGAVQKAKDKADPHKDQDPKKFGGQAKKLPTRIMTAGLGHAMAFLKAKNEAPGLIAEISDWINKQIPPADGQPRDLCERIVNGDSQFLRRATDETLSYLQWLNRFAEAEGLRDDQDED